jgi:hypothetical protein
MKPYLDCNKNPLIIGNFYHLVTYENGERKKPEEHWIKVVWNGSHLIDTDGCSWDEWLGYDVASREDIVPL